jgi:hypothetical protein
MVNKRWRLQKKEGMPLPRCSIKSLYAPCETAGLYIDSRDAKGYCGRHIDKAGGWLDVSATIQASTKNWDEGDVHYDLCTACSEVRNLLSVDC